MVEVHRILAGIGAANRVGDEVGFAAIRRGVESSLGLLGKCREIPALRLLSCGPLDLATLHSVPSFAKATSAVVFRTTNAGNISHVRSHQTYNFHHGGQAERTKRKLERHETVNR
jgi:hypothetical protein